MRSAIRGVVALLGWCLCTASLAAGWTAALPNGQALNIVEGATATASGYFLERRYGAGNRDPQFGNAGRTFFTLGSDNSPPASLQVDAAGRILISGTADVGNGRNSLVVLRFLPSGQVDANWGQQGRSLVDAPRGNANATDTLALADGQVFVIGTIDDEQSEHAALWRFTERGQLDSAFGAGGLMHAVRLPQSQGLAILQDVDGTLHLALQAGRGDKTWLEVHRWKAGAAGPVRVASQEFPDEWVGPPALLRRGDSWVWTDTSQPLTPPLELVAAAAESMWTASAGAAPPLRAESTTPAGHAAVNPFNESLGSTSGATTISLDDLAWPGMLLSILALLAGALWWWWRRG